MQTNQQADKSTDLQINRQTESYDNALTAFDQYIYFVHHTGELCNQTGKKRHTCESNPSLSLDGLIYLQAVSPVTVSHVSRGVGVTAINAVTETAISK